MPFTADELNVVNMALARIGATRLASISDTTSNEAIQSLLHYEQTRNALLRSHAWNFAKSRSALVNIQTLTLDSQPVASAWAVGDVITGISSNETATIIAVTSATVYEIAYLSGDFDDAEKLTNATVEEVYWEGQALTWEDETILWWETSGSLDVQCSTGYPSVADSTPDFEWDYQYLLPSDFLRMVSNYSESDFDDPSERWEIEGSRLLTNDSEANIRYIRKVTDPTEFDSLFVEILVLQLALKLIPALAGSMSGIAREAIRTDLQNAMNTARTINRQENNTSGQRNWNNARLVADNGTP